MAISHAFSNAIPDGTNTNIVRPIDWNSAHNFQQDIAGNTAGVSSVSGTNIVWAGGNNVTLSANGQTISVIAGTAAPSPVNVSAGTASGDLGTVVFSNSNGVSFGLNGSTITATVATNYQSQGAYLTTAALSNHSHGNPTLNLTNLSGTTASNSAGFTLSLSAVNALTTARASNDAVGLATAQSNVTWTVNSAGLSLDARGYAGTATTFAGANLSGSMTVNSNGVNLSLSAGNYLTTAAVSNHSHGASGANGSFGFQTLSFSNANGVSFATSAGSAIVASVETSYAASNHSHGNPTLALTNISGTTASNSAGLTLSLSAANPGGGAGNTISYFENFPGITNLADIIPGQSSSFVQPFVLPGAISADYLRLFLTMATNSTSFATTANTTFSCQRASTWNAVVYVQGTGLSSASLQSYASGSAGMTQSVNLAANANGSQYTVTIGMTYPMTGGTSSYSTSYATSQTRFDLSSESMTLFTGNLRALDIAFGNALPQSNYWLMVGRNSTVTTQGTAIMSQLLVSEQLKAYSQFNTQLRMMGQLSNATVQLRPGVGSFSTNAIGTTESLGLSNITFMPGNVFPFFQLIRHA